MRFRDSRLTWEMQLDDDIRAAAVEVHLFAPARAAAGVSLVIVQPGVLREVLNQAAEKYPGLAEVLPRCSYLVDEVSATADDLPVAPGSRVDVLPPFAGG